MEQVYHAPKLLALSITIFSWNTLSSFLISFLLLEKNHIPEELDLITQLLFLAIVFKVLIYVFKADNIYYFRRLIKKNNGHYILDFDSDNGRFSKEWELQGNPISTSQGLVVTNSNSGMMITPKRFWLDRVWKNFEARITVKYSEQKLDINDKKVFKKLIGIVFRAQDFGNYFMLEIWKENALIVIRPHTRINGNWDAPVLNPDANAITVDDRESYVFILQVSENKASLKINGFPNKSLDWILPTHYEINLRQHPEQKNDDLKEGNVSRIPFRLSTGRFGFRNYGDEIANVSKVEIKDI